MFEFIWAGPVAAEKNSVSLLRMSAAFALVLRDDERFFRYRLEQQATLVSIVHIIIVVTTKNIR
jgi:hypothetical protein